MRLDLTAASAKREPLPIRSARGTPAGETEIGFPAADRAAKRLSAIFARHAGGRRTQSFSVVNRPAPKSAARRSS